MTEGIDSELRIIESLNEPQDPSYVDLRENEYPEITQQLDMIYHDMVNGSTTWVDAITSVKNKYPKTMTRS